MLKKSMEMLKKASELMNGRKKHIADDKYDYYTFSRDYVAVVPLGTPVKNIENFKCRQFALIDKYDFKNVEF